MKSLAGRLIVLCILVASSANCSDKGYHAYLEVALQNRTGKEIDQTGIIFDKRRCTFGVLGSSAHKMYLGWQYPVLTNAVVYWRENDSLSRTQVVSLIKVYDRNVPGALWFSINPTNVLVDFIKKPR